MKKSHGWIAVGVVAGGIALLAVREAASEAQQEERVASVLNIMKGVQQPSMAAVMKASRTPPASDKEWEATETAAAMLNETGHMLIQANRCPDDTWAKACAELRQLSGQAAKAAKEKNAAGIKELAPKISATCKSCHDAHKK